jgi:hypothetical protein
VAHREATTIAILGADPVVENALTLLLEGSGYNTKIGQESPTALAADGLLDGVDLLLLAPDLSSGVRDVLLSVVRGNPKTAAMPVLTLSTALKETLSDQTGMVPWPSRWEDLRRAIEAALRPATSGQG